MRFEAIRGRRHDVGYCEKNDLDKLEAERLYEVSVSPSSASSALRLRTTLFAARRLVGTDLPGRRTRLRPKESLQAPQKAKAQFDLSPTTFIEIPLQCWANLLQDVLRKLGLLHIDKQHDRGDERDFQGLFDGAAGRDQYAIAVLKGGRSQC